MTKGTPLEIGAGALRAACLAVLLLAGCAGPGSERNLSPLYSSHSAASTRFRGGVGIGYKWLHAGTEIGQDLDGGWRPRVTAGVKIPLGN